jgi:hypothetical protein
MPSAVPIDPVPLPKWQRPGKTEASLPWADFVVIDLSKFDEPQGKQKLANQLRDAVGGGSMMCFRLFDATHLKRPGPDIATM